MQTVKVKLLIRNRKSVIDYIIINKSLHNNFECMKIDEDKLEFDL